MYGDKKKAASPNAAQQHSTSPKTHNNYNPKTAKGQVFPVKDTEAEIQLIFNLLVGYTNTEAIRRDLNKISFLQEDDFFNPINGVIYRVIKNVVFEKNLIPDIVTIKDYVKENNIDLNLNYVISITSALDLDKHAIIPNIYHYARIIKDKAIKRKLASLTMVKLEAIQRDASQEELISIDEQIKQLEKESTLLTDTSELIKYPTDEDLNARLKLVCNNIFPVGYVSLLIGESGVGKTYTAINLALQFIAETKQKALLWLSEDLGQVGFRIMRTIINNPNWSNKKEFLMQKIAYVDATPIRLLEKRFGSVVVNHANLSLLKKFIDEFDFIVLDPLISFYGGNENESGEARLFIDTLNSIIMKSEKVIILIHHTNKTNILSEDTIQALRAKVRGSSGFLDAVRTAVFVRTVKDKPNTRELVVIKSNVGKVGEVEQINMPFTGGSDDKKERDEEDLF